MAVNATMEKLWDVILQIGSIAGLISLVFTASTHLRSKKKFSFEFRSSQGKVTSRDNLEFYDVYIHGYIKNESSEPNSITRVNYIIWANRARTRALTFGFGADITDDKSIKINEPILFAPYEGKNLNITFRICLTGTHNRELVCARREIRPGLSVPRYNFELAFTDINERLFDNKGVLRCQKLINLWWTLPNKLIALKRRNPAPYIWHLAKIGGTSVVFRFRKLFWQFGI